jgi:hypothetical protein
MSSEHAAQWFLLPLLSGHEAVNVPKQLLKRDGHFDDPAPPSHSLGSKVRIIGLVRHGQWGFPAIPGSLVR